MNKMEESFVIKASERKTLRRKIDKINEMFNVKVEVILDPNPIEDDIQWVHIRGTKIDDVDDAKIHIIALCSPEITERITFCGFPLFIFTAFKERCKHNVQRGCGVVLSVTDDEYLIIQGSNIGVTLAISQIHHLRKLHQDKDPNKEREAALRFDLYVEGINDDLQEELQALSNPLKKELLSILNIPLSAGEETIPKVLATSSPTKIYPKLSSSVVNGANSEPKKINSPGIVTIDDSVIVLSSSSDEIESDDDADNTLSSSVEYDGYEESFVLPPNFVILEWIKVNYEATNNSMDFVNKNDMLDHFKTHFDLPDDPELANKFFDKLAVRIFPSDPNYRAVRTKKTKSKQGRRRLICLKKRTLSGGEKDMYLSRAKNVQPKASSSLTGGEKAVYLSQAKNMQPEASSSSVPLVRAPLQPQLTPNVMKEWNASRTGLSMVPNIVNQPQPVPHSLPQPQHTVPPHQTIPPRYPNSNQQYPNLQTWLGSVSQPVPKPRTQPRYEPKRQDNEFNSIAKRVSLMTNDELIKKSHPPVDTKLRPIVIDGSNVAMSHGNHSNFSCRGIAICIRFFIERGHGSITCFVPNYRKGGGGYPPSSDANLLIALEKKGFVKSTPSRRIQGKNIVCYDDRFIVELAGATDGVIISNDQYRDLMTENRKFRLVVEQQLLQYTIVGDLLMFPEDPLGVNGPSLEQYLTIPRTGPSAPLMQRVVKVPSPARRPVPQPAYKRPRPTQHAPVTGAWSNRLSQAAQPTLSPDQVVLCYEMMKVFPDRENDIRQVIRNHPLEKDLENLMNYLLINDSG